MNDLERFLRDRNADADTWIDDEGLHVHDWETDRCLVFDANESDYAFICIYIHALRTLSVFGACLAEISTFDLTLTKIENDNAEILDGSIKTTAPLSELEPYRKTPQGMAPISMSAAQEHTVNAICATLGYQFNGLCMHDVSTFIGLFKEESMKKGHAK